jgi:hypothetical protein
MLLKKLTEVERQGKEDIKKQKIMMDNEYAQFFQDFKDNEQKKAEKNISDIERNIMVQNLRLQDEA